MATYEIVPYTDLKGSDLLEIKRASRYNCKRLCSSDENCNSFVYNPHENKCYLKSAGSLDFYTNASQPFPDKHRDLYIKKENKNYWEVWILIFGMFMVIYLNMCK